ncbi:hypothetical protein Hanom_Chr14g01323841 [Helianthus anomalus]
MYYTASLYIYLSPFITSTTITIFFIKTPATTATGQPPPATTNPSPPQPFLLSTTTPTCRPPHPYLATTTNPPHHPHLTTNSPNSVDLMSHSRMKP